MRIKAICAAVLVAFLGVLGMSPAYAAPMHAAMPLTVTCPGNGQDLENDLYLHLYDSGDQQGHVVGTSTADTKWCITDSSYTGYYFIYENGTSLCLNWDQDGGYVRVLTCAGITSDRWGLDDATGFTQVYDNWYNGEDLKVTGIGADATVGGPCGGSPCQSELWQIFNT